MDLTVHLKQQAINDPKNLFPETIGRARIIPNQPAGEIEDRDLEIAELLARELTELGILYTAAEMRLIRKWIRDKRLTTMGGIENAI